MPSRANAMVKDAKFLIPFKASDIADKAFLILGKRTARIPARVQNIMPATISAKTAAPCADFCCAMLGG